MDMVGDSDYNNQDPTQAEILPDYVAWSTSPGFVRTMFFIILIILIIFVIVIYIVGCSASNKNSYIDFSKTKFDKSTLQAINRNISVHGTHGEIPNNTSSTAAMPNTSNNWNGNGNVYGNGNGASANTYGEFNHFSNAENMKTKQTCESNKNSFWSDGKCKCKAPYWGGDCSREFHTDQYKGIGNVKNINPMFMKTDVELKFLTKHLVTHKYFSKDTRIDGCEQLCNKNEKCKGYFYLGKDINDKTNENNNNYLGVNDLNGANGANGINGTDASKSNYCYLLSEIPKASDLYFSINQDPEIYLNKARTDGRPILNQTLFLSNGKLPYRFWLESRLSNSLVNMIQINFDIVYRLQFHVENITTDVNSMLVFSNKPMTTSSGREAMNSYNNKNNKNNLDNFVFYSTQNRPDCKNIVPISWSNYCVVAFKIVKEVIEIIENKIEKIETDLSYSESSSCDSSSSSRSEFSKLFENSDSSSFSSVTNKYPYAENSTIVDCNDKLYNFNNNYHNESEMFHVIDSSSSSIHKKNKNKKKKYITDPLNDQNNSLIFNDE
jgi:hypothetical protein